MISMKRLRNIVHSIAHHAMSGLCYVHPHLGTLAKDLGIKSISVNLINSNFDPEIPSPSKELLLSTNALREKFQSLLSSEDISLEDIQSAWATFDFLHGVWPTSCYVRIEITNGKFIEDAVDSTGQRAEILHTNS